MANRTERNRRYQEKIKAERAELAQLRKDMADGKLIYTTPKDGGGTDLGDEAQLDKEARWLEVRARYDARRKAEAAQAASTTTTTPPKKPTPTDSGSKKDTPRMSPPVSPPQRQFISIADLDTQEKVKRALRMGELADMSEAFQKTLFQGDPVLRQEWEDYQEIVLGRGRAAATHTPPAPNVTRLTN